MAEVSCAGCSTPGTCAAHGCAVPTEAEKLERARAEAHRALDAAERAWYAYAGMIDVGPDRTRAFTVYEQVRMARRVW